MGYEDNRLNIIHNINIYSIILVKAFVGVSSTPNFKPGGNYESNNTSCCSQLHTYTEHQMLVKIRGVLTSVTDKASSLDEHDGITGRI